MFFKTNISPARLHQFKLDKKLFKQLLHIQSWKRFTLKRVAYKYCLQIPAKFSSKCEKDLNYVWVNFSTCWIEKNYFTSKSFKRYSYRRASMLKCNFNKVAKKLYWNKTSVVVSSVNLLHIFRIPFLSEHVQRTASVCFGKHISLTKCASIFQVMLMSG